MRRLLVLSASALCAVALAPLPLQTTAAAGEGHRPVSHGLDPYVLVGVALILILAKLCGELFERIGQPAVLGELLGGIIVGNLTLVVTPPLLKWSLESAIAPKPRAAESTEGLEKILQGARAEQIR